MHERCEIRLERLRRRVAREGVDALLVTDFANVTYLTGFTGGDSWLLVRPDGQTLISDFRFIIQLEEESPGLDALIRRSSTGMTIAEFAAKALAKMRIGRLAVEAHAMTLATWEKLGEKLTKTEFVATSEWVERMRRVKDKGEVARIRKAAEYAERGFAALRATLRRGQTEKQVADDLDHQMRLFGARDRAFPTIVAAGPRAALPHAMPGNYEIGRSDFVLVDWGANEGLYNSDLTRLLVTGRISPKLERIYGVVLKAQQKGIAAIRPGVRAQEVDRAARRVIAKAGYDRYFGHGLGHGVGLHVHEAPRLAMNNPLVLRAGMVITVEPGIYLPEWGGVRIEDDVLVTRSGHEVLTHAPKQLEEMVIG